MIDRKNLLDQPVKNNIRTNNNIQKIATSQGDDYISGSLLDYVFFHKIIAINLSKQEALIQKQVSKLILLEI